MQTETTATTTSRAKTSRASGSLGRGALASLTGAVVAALVGSVLPSAEFRTHAVVAIDGGGPTVGAPMERAVADAAVSRPVIWRAAASLIGTGLPVSEPTLFQRIALATGLGETRATSHQARLADVLARTAEAAPGVTPGTIDIVATDRDAGRAATIATALAEALIAEHDDNAAAVRRDLADADATRLDSLKDAAAAAHRRLASLGSVDTDDGAARAAAASRTASAESRLAMIHAIIASGKPPLGDGQDTPPSAESLQKAYLDLSAQLAKARETLGDRHTTIISLTAGVRRAAADLTAEWKRLARIAEADLSAARDAEANLHHAAASTTAAPADIEEARATVRRADADVARAASLEPPVEDRAYRLVVRAPIPTAAIGFPAVVRAMLTVVAGLLAAAIILVLRPRSSEPKPIDTPSRMTADLPIDAPDILRHEAELRMLDERADPPFEAQEAPAAPSHPSVAALLGAADNAAEPAAEPDLEPAEAEAHSDTDPAEAMRDALSAIAAIAPKDRVPTVVVAASEPGESAAQVAVALARFAAAEGCRVLLVEAARDHTELAAAADPDGEPVLIDAFGSLRVTLPARGGDGLLQLAPWWPEGMRIATALARSGEARFCADLAEEFDLVVLDGRPHDAADCPIDAVLRVGPSGSPRDDERFLTTLDLEKSVLVGSIFDAAFVPKRNDAPLDRAGRSSARRAAATSVVVLAADGRRARPAPPSSASGRRRHAGR